MLYNQFQTQQSEETDVLVESEKTCRLIVWNDDINTFEWVIETLIDICDHTPEQAEQCAWLIHSKGKYAVKNGSFDTLKPLCDAINERFIDATVESDAS
ncbi:MAG: ATP-dependent Clp protease adaptor ClpS [Lacibacter sp.]